VMRCGVDQNTTVGRSSGECSGRPSVRKPRTLAGNTSTTVPEHECPYDSPQKTCRLAAFLLQPLQMAALAISSDGRV
jgi:hypothetical protein